MVKPQFEVGRERIGKGGVVRDPELRREAVERRGRARAGRRGAGLRPLGAAGPDGQPRDVPVARGGGPGRGRRAEVAAPMVTRDAAPSSPTGGRETAGALRELIDAARAAGAHAALHADETAKHGSSPAPASSSTRRGRRRRPVHRAGRRRHDPHRAAPLRGHRRAGVRRQLRRGRLPGHDRPGRARATDFDRAFAGEFETLELPAISRRPARRHWTP